MTSKPRIAQMPYGELLKSKKRQQISDFIFVSRSKQENGDPFHHHPAGPAGAT